MNILCVAAIGSIRLDVDTIRAVVEVEVVDVAGAHERVEGCSNLAERDTHGLGLLAVDGDEKLRVIGSEGGVHAGEAGGGRASLTHEGMGNAVDIAEGIAARVLQDELESADGADAGDGGGLGGEGDAAGDAEELRPDVKDNSFGGVFVAHFCALVNGFERSKDEARVWRTTAREREAHDREGAEDTFVLANNGRNLIGEV
jgi:hypothetical protein